MFFLIGIILVLWLLGLLGHIAGGFIHLLLIVALVIWIVNMLTGDRV